MDTVEVLVVYFLSLTSAWLFAGGCRQIAERIAEWWD